MTMLQPLPAFTPCFDWVVRATGDSSTAQAYGVIWRYAQLRGARCYASCELLAAELAWSRQRLMRHIRRLLDRGLIVCLNPAATGVPHEYLPVAYEQWIAAPQPEAASAPPKGPTQGLADERTIRQGPLGGETCNDGGDISCAVSSHPTVTLRDSPRDISPQPPVTAHDAPCTTPSRPPVAACDTNNTIQDTKDTKERPVREIARVQGRSPAERRRPAASAAPRAPGLDLVKHLTGKIPPRAIHEQVLDALGAAPSVERLRACYEEWCIRGYNPRNLAWLLEWYASGVIPPNKPPGRANRTPADDLAASPEEFGRWHDYQQALQQGEDPDDTKRRLGL